MAKKLWCSAYYIKDTEKKLGQFKAQRGKRISNYEGEENHKEPET